VGGRRGLWFGEGGAEFGGVVVAQDEESPQRRGEGVEKFLGGSPATFFQSPGANVPGRR